MSETRPAAVAGSFYPGDGATLARDIQGYLGEVQRFDPPLGFPKVLIVPHAGYVYSGPVAAVAYDAIAPARGIVRRVVLLGPAHRVAFRGMALPAANVFATPLGTVRVDREAAGALTGLPQVVRGDAPHADEHALEVQLPFLQSVLGEFSLVPLVVGQASPGEVAQVLEALWGGPETLIVISTDLSHFHPYDEARGIDQATIARIVARSPDIRHEEACGATPLNGLLALLRARGLAVTRMADCNSGDTAGGRGRVVGYAAFAVYEQTGTGVSASEEQAGPVLLSIARHAIESRLDMGARMPPEPDAAWLKVCAASFITLTRDGALRGCIGSLEPHRALGRDVTENAVAAAFRDPRFAPVTPADWPGIRVEVSLLSRPKPVQFADEAELLAVITPDIDGLIIAHEGRRATFLLQVWESIPDPRQFLRELRRKAGIAADTPVVRCTLSRYRVTKWKEPQERVA